MSSFRRAAGTLSFVALAMTSSPTNAADPVKHEFVIHNFRTESGVVLPEAHIVYGTYGTLERRARNAMLLPSHYMARAAPATNG